MPVAICSLKWDAAQDGRQSVTYDSDGYHLVRFPYGAGEENYDPWRMHDPAKGGGSSAAFPHPRSGLIWPSHDGWGVLSALVFWEPDSGPTEYRTRFVRDPLGLSTGYDSTATTDSAPTRGSQFRSYVWQMFVHPNTPVGLKISARGVGDVRKKTPITHAQFKLAIHTDVLRP
ncbi:hypothetical protein DCW30_21195 [Streptomyces alfalfae]|uniref:Uncharacterized protein n=1 Tax=Streptomyces alfalfae TaxID=1642299 RepID=A0A1P8TN94_9ACTN|nr:hypothetical protein [Streptomyces alfalfae]AYA19533.1 hypothetical protein D3X13_27690 [Streptomyces fradiae]APY89111.1 hypothetical protein A7J05_28490 [Streptomyces alfalfae]QQC88485.1 hypothetical protein I8755_08730 [Streptomyces alfalfae]QUI30943.1 hypothetical protein H9W91_08785 [Streptomyces alfalfae]RXX40937.1 hypothetical protein DCW30_21195 [Streptomyces alfalfae]